MSKSPRARLRHKVNSAFKKYMRYSASKKAWKRYIRLQRM